MDLRWLDAPAADVAAALAVAGERPRPAWRPTRRQVLLHVNNALVLWFASIGFLTIGIQVDGVQDGRVLPADALAFTVVSLVLVVWLAGTFLLWRWARRPLATRAPRPLIGPDGRRLDARTPQTGIGPVVERLAWVGFRAGLYLVPLLFAFAGFMSIVDGR
ncbi:hypothetical protein ACO03V_09325 [Microbacterium sp. HMH0099]|uniref:hypothetical protein n=1 Tax=Microbacterium sp. HMH0099 TaxID=3414026 RepID=UPI003BF71234